MLGALAALLGAVAVNDTATAGHALDRRRRLHRLRLATGRLSHPGRQAPHCCNVRGDSDRSAFYLTRRQIRALSAQGVRTDTMVPGAWAEVQAVCKKHRKH